MKTPRSRKRKARKGPKLGANLLNSTTTSLNTNFAEPEEVTGHFLYNEKDDAIQQVVKLPDISVNDFAGKKSESRSNLSLPPISPEKNACEERKGAESYDRTTKLPCISTEKRGGSDSGQFCSTQWLDRHEVTTISWKKALDILDNKTKDTEGKQRRRHNRKVPKL